MTQAQQEAQILLKDAQAAIEAIQAQMAELVQKLEKEPKNWGHTGSLGHYTEVLTALAENR